MNCVQVREVLDSFMKGTLKGEESRAVRVHLASCSECASGLSPSELMEILPALDEAIEPSEDFALRFHSALQDRRLRRAFSRRSHPRWMRISAWGRPWQLVAAGGLVVLLAAGIFLGRNPRGAANQPEYLGDIAVAENLPLLQDMAVISNLDLLEDFDAIENLTLRPQGRKTQRSNP